MASSRGATVALVAVLAAGAAIAPAAAQGTPLAVGARLAEVSGTCHAGDVALEGTLSVALPAGAVVAHAYSVSAVGASLDLGTSEVEATGAAGSTLPWHDDVWFGPRWPGTLPYTYRQEAAVLVDGGLVHTQVLEATCTAAGEPAEVTLSEGTGPVPPSPGGGGGAPVVPRFAG